MLARFFTIFFLLLFLHAPAQNGIALLDLTQRNGESTDGNRFSAEHALKVAGIPYFVTDSVNLALRSSLILCSSNIEPTTFFQSERDSLRAFVQRGNTLFITNLKDTALYSLFGVRDYQYSTQRYEMRWLHAASDPLFRWLDDPMEIDLKLGDTSYSDVIGTRGYDVTTAQALAKFEDDSAAACVNGYGQGHAVLLGLAWKDVILRNQMAQHFDAARSFSNGFEPQSDVFMLFLRAVYAKYNPWAVWKHTSGLNSRSTLIITHDVDATTGMQGMNDFAGYEAANDIRATYFVTTHYMHDSLAKDFYTIFTDELALVRGKGHELSSHSVSHVPDFDDESIVPQGNCGNTELTYRPFWNGISSSGVSVCGEVEVSKLLLERDLGVGVRSFRAGYLAYNDKIINALEDNGYSYNSSQSANNVLSAFPFQAHKDLSMSGAISSVYEIPNTISDVFHDDPIWEGNYLQKAMQWTDVVARNANNNAPSVLLIHPNRRWKIDGEQYLLRHMPAGQRVRPFDQFGDYWRARESCAFGTRLLNDSVLLVTILNSSLPLHPDMSFVVNDGQSLFQILVQDENGNPIPLLRSPWEGNDLILHSENFDERYDLFTLNVAENFSLAAPYPNPFTDETSLLLELMEGAHVRLDLFDPSGRWVAQAVNENLFVGPNTLRISRGTLGQGLYFFRLNVGGTQRTGKLIVAE